MIDFTSHSKTLPGYRLHKLEVYNWGTFDSTRGNVFTVRTNGEMALLIGQNGSGKSTLVDALLTLLVRPRVRNYNVAAGAKKRERDERSYIKGAFDRRSSTTENAAAVRYLREGNQHYSCLLACFHNAGSKKTFTVALLLFVTAEGKSEKVYCFADNERSIADDFSSLKTMDKLPAQLKKRGLQATTSYTEYHNWFSRVTGQRPKAMDMLNQTVAVKDIESLNTFIRDHMLETKPWADRVDSLLDHFTQLSQAHQSLVRIRRQSELLQPIAEVGARYRQQAVELVELQEMLAAADLYFRQKTKQLLEPRLKQHRSELTKVARRRTQLGKQIDTIQDEARRLQNDIESGGGDRSGRIPLQIQAETNKADNKLETARRLNDHLATLNIGSVRTQRQFVAAQKRLTTIHETSTASLMDIDHQRDLRIVEREELQKSIGVLQQELDTLKNRKNNLPEALHCIRTELCKVLDLGETELPFVAELLTVHPDEGEWEASIEMALGGFAHSLLVPAEHEATVSKYVERTQLVDNNNVGHKLVYLQATANIKPARQKTVLHPHSMLRKLKIRQGHPLSGFVKQHLIKNFDIRCCPTISAFQKSTVPAMTRKRHLSRGNGRLEKDDRERTTNSRHYVLGWNNSSKRQLLSDRIGRLTDGLQQVNERIDVLNSSRADVQTQLACVADAKSIDGFQSIDVGVHEKAIAVLTKELTSLQAGGDVITQLRTQLQLTNERRVELNQLRDNEVGNARLLQSDIDRVEKVLTTAREQLAAAKADGTLKRHKQQFTALDECFAKRPLTADTLSEREPKFLQQQRNKLEKLRRKIEPLRTRLTTAMNRFLRDFADERADLDAQVDYLDSFLGVLKRIEDDDLPRHERRFRERLNEKVTQEIGFLNGALHGEATEIRTRIDTLNKSLACLEYRPGTFMKLEPRPVKDREIAGFQSALAECLADKFDGRHDADEARFLKIEKLIKRLREEERWRAKVTDVRRWFDFAALEIESATGEERTCYTDSAGQSGGEKAKLAFTILVAAIAYQYDIDPDAEVSDRFHFVVVDEMFSKVDDKYSEYALELFRRFGLQLLIVAPLDAKARVTEPYVGCYLHVVKNETTNHSEIFTMTAGEFQDAVVHRKSLQAESQRATPK